MSGTPVNLLTFTGAVTCMAASITGYHGLSVNLIPIRLLAIDIPTHVFLHHRFDLFEEARDAVA